MDTSHRAWRAYLILGLTAAAAHLALPSDGSAQSYAFLLIAVSAPVAMVIGLGRRARTWSWTLVLLGIVLMVAGDVLWTYYELIADVDPFPSFADGLYLPGYPLIAFGLLLMLHTRRHGSERSGLIDATIIATGCGVLSWMFLIAPYVRDTDLTIAERAVSSAYPLMGVLLVAVVARLGFSDDDLRTSDVLIGLGLIALLVADTYLGVLELTVGYEWHAIPEFLWLAMYVLFGAAALTPEAPSTAADQTPTSATFEDGRLPRLRLPLLLVASLMAPSVLAWHAVRGHSVDLLVIAAGSSLLFVLVLTRVFGLVRQVEQKAAQVATLAVADPLTGLANRRHWDDEITRLIALAGRTGRPLCVVMLDLDHFKLFNDTHGHYAGDTLLRDCADAWRGLLRETDVLARVGGEEFALALADCPIERAEQVVDRLRDVMPGNQNFSAGIATWNGTESPDQLLIRADMALYAAKAAGRARTVRADTAASDHAGTARR